MTRYDWPSLMNKTHTDDTDTGTKLVEHGRVCFGRDNGLSIALVLGLRSWFSKVVIVPNAGRLLLLFLLLVVPVGL